ncbi:hypothetical protein [Burkholderia ubonensis]|uniref:hypothetical protein n=1 Tax=Burkholderia ubonensis TaxID=101571 RepID=UPI00075B9868|nr:hypothetical protein [Burkholderia ubonensis]KVU77513.1 hypothetical protein WK74_27435 [Burkholderia ubonensis]
MKTETMKIQTSTGEKEVTLHVFPALTGFDLDRRYRVDYVMERESRTKRLAYTLDVLAHAEVAGARLDNEQAINAALESWKNVEAVFNAVLKHNEVDLELAEEKARWFEFAGAELAASFVAEAAQLLAPLAQIIDQQKSE